MYITKSEELHMELEAARYEGQQATREARIGLVSPAYALAALNVWDDALDRWEGNNTRPKVSLERECIVFPCHHAARRWVTGRYDTGETAGFAACREHAEAQVVRMDAHFLMRRVDFLEETQMDDYYDAGHCPQDGGEY